MLKHTASIYTVIYRYSSVISTFPLACCVRFSWEPLEPCAVCSLLSTWKNMPSCRFTHGTVWLEFGIWSVMILVGCDSIFEVLRCSALRIPYLEVFWGSLFPRPHVRVRTVAFHARPLGLLPQQSYITKDWCNFGIAAPWWLRRLAWKKQGLVRRTPCSLCNEKKSKHSVRCTRHQSS